MAVSSVTGGMPYAQTSNINYGPMLAGGAQGFAQNMYGYWQQQAARPGQTPWERAQSQQALAGWRQQSKAMGQPPAQQPAQHPMGGEGWEGTPAQTPAQPAAQPTATPAKAPTQAAPNPLLTALQGSPMSQGVTRTSRGPLLAALNQAGVGTGDDLAARLHALFNLGGN